MIDYKIKLIIRTFLMVRQSHTRRTENSIMLSELMHSRISIKQKIIWNSCHIHSHLKGQSIIRFIKQESPLPEKRKEPVF